MVADTGAAVEVIGDELTLPRSLNRSTHREPTLRHHTPVECTLIDVRLTNPARVATRYDKLEADYPAFLKLASIRLVGSHPKPA